MSHNLLRGWRFARVDDAAVCIPACVGKVGEDRVDNSTQSTLWEIGVGDAKSRTRDLFDFGLAGLTSSSATPLDDDHDRRDSEKLTLSDIRIDHCGDTVRNGAHGNSIEEVQKKAARGVAKGVGKHRRIHGQELYESL